MEKQKIYAKRPSSLESPIEWMTGVEGFRVLNGRLATFVLLQDGSLEPLSDLLVITDRQRKGRIAPLWST
jgi:hypothetical protein